MRYRALQQLLNASWRRRRSTADQIERRRAKSSAGGRAPPFDKTIYAHRNTAERGFGRLKRGRGIASRYDKCAITYPSPRAGLRYLRIATPGG